MFSWRQFVKKKAKEFEFKRLMKLKKSKNESELKNVKYERLEGQQYLTTLDVRKAKTVFRFRTKMAQFSGNYKGQGPIELCPLCGSHSDHQEMSFRCPVVRGKMKLAEEYENIFESKISHDLANNLQQIENLRRKED